MGVLLEMFFYKNISGRVILSLGLNEMQCLNFLPFEASKNLEGLCKSVSIICWKHSASPSYRCFYKFLKGQSRAEVSFEIYVPSSTLRSLPASYWAQDVHFKKGNDVELDKINVIVRFRIGLHFLFYFFRCNFTVLKSLFSFIFFIPLFLSHVYACSW